MAYAIVMPRLGWTMEEGIFVEWLKHDGDVINPGDLLCSVEGDKAINEIESFEGGVLCIPPDAPPPGAKVKVGTLLGYVLAPGEDVPFDVATSAAEQPSPAVRTAAAAVPAAPDRARLDSRLSEPTISPRARRIAIELGVEWKALKGSGRTGRIVERDVRAAASAPPPIAKPAAASGELRFSPLARRRAEELGVDLKQLAQAQAGKRIEVADVESAVRSAMPQPAAPMPETEGPLSPIRRLIAERMSASARATAAVTLTTEADATELVRLRNAIGGDLKGTNAAVPTYNDLLAKVAAVALLEHPALNASLDGARIVRHPAVHVGIAVDTERGLVVPVVRDVQSKSVRTIAAESAHLIEQVRAGKISPDDLRGGTFTLTNLGMYEIDAFTPIINLPECAILGVGRIVAKQVVVDDQTEAVAVRRMMALSLTFDHRLVDGGPAARFLQRFKQLIEHPYAWLIQ